MKVFYTAIMIIISLLISVIIRYMGEISCQDVYWLNTGVLVMIIGVAAWFRYKEYEKNKNV